MTFDWIWMVSPIVMGSPAKVNTLARHKQRTKQVVFFTKPPDTELIDGFENAASFLLRADAQSGFELAEFELRGRMNLIAEDP